MCRERGRERKPISFSIVCNYIFIYLLFICQCVTSPNDQRIINRHLKFKTNPYNCATAHKKKKNNNKVVNHNT